MKPNLPGPLPANPTCHLKPRLQQLLQTLRLDVSYERGQGDYLYYRDAAGAEVNVLDLVGGYGSLLFGHNHPALVEEAQRVLAGGRPMHAQGSRREPAQLLAGELSRRAGGDFCVVFGNSGAEAVEAAIKHAMLETGGRTFIALERGFHGKTLGALQLTANPHYRDAFSLAGIEVLRVAANDVTQLEAAFASATELAGFIFEPVLGEGGIHPLTPQFLQRASELCAEHEVPLIADECQTGMGRCGTFLASETLGVQPDYIVLSKSLGGGLAKISALLVQRERYCDAFDLKHTSTYAEDDFSCAIALKALSLVDAPFLQQCAEKGVRIREGLRQLADRFPGVIAEVRGSGLMLAIQFQPLRDSASFLLRFLNSREDLGYLLTGYLLNVHRIRVAPTLSDRFSLRLEPSAFIKETEIQRLLDALEDVCARLARADALGLTRFLNAESGTQRLCAAARSDAQFIAYDEPTFHLRQQRIPSVKLAWLCHFIDADDLLSLEPAFRAIPFDEREDLLAHMTPLAAPVVMSSVDVRSITGRSARIYPILLPFTSRWVKRMLDRGDLALPQSLVQAGVDLAESLDCQMVSLGQYTSIATLNGLRVAPGRIGVTNGNSFALALAIQAIERAQRETGLRPEDSTLVIVGAAGNIGRTCAEILAPRYRHAILIGSGKPGSVQRMETFTRRLPNAIATTELDAVRHGHVVLAALNAVDAPIKADLLARNAIVCDLSVPSALAPDVGGQRPDVVLIKGGVVSLPYGEDLEVPGFPLPQGQTFGCMAEAMLLGWEGIIDRSHTGSLTSAQVARISALAERHGFALSDYKRRCVFGTNPNQPGYAITH